MNKREISIAIRKAYKREEVQRDACYICDKWKEISHFHHVIGVSELTNWSYHEDVLWNFFPITVVWLCPNHHALVHRLRDKGMSMEDKCKMLDHLNMDERDALQQLVELRENDLEKIRFRAAMLRGIRDIAHGMRVLEEYETQKS